MQPRDETPQAAGHRACETLTRLTIAHLPREGTLGRVRRWPKGSDIWLPAHRADRVYFLETGQVTVLVKDSHGHDVIIRIVKVGAVFGELCFCAEEGGLRHSRATAMRESRAREIRHADFVTHLQNHRAALGAFAFSLCTELSAAEQRMEVLANRGADERLGRLLLQLALRVASPGVPVRRFSR